MALNDVIQRACQLAKRIQQRAVELQTPAERRQQAELDRMLQHPEDKVTLTQMTDQGFRSRSPDRAVDQLIHILDVQGIPRFFSQLDRALLRGFPIVWQLPARRGRANGQRQDAERDQQRHLAGRTEACSASIWPRAAMKAFA